MAKLFIEELEVRQSTSPLFSAMNVDDHHHSGDHSGQSPVQNSGSQQGHQVMTTAADPGESGRTQHDGGAHDGAPPKPIATTAVNEGGHIGDNGGGHHYITTANSNVEGGITHSPEGNGAGHGNDPVVTTLAMGEEGSPVADPGHGSSGGTMTTQAVGIGEGGFLSQTFDRAASALRRLFSAE